MSADGSSAIVVIALLGSPFSPRYARRRHGVARALDHCAMNVAVYHRKASSWALRERAISNGTRTPDELAFGASALRWRGNSLIIDIDERTTPMGRPIRGQVVLHPEIAVDAEVPIDAHQSHRWWPIAPVARIEVDLFEPALRFRGHGYCDANAGDVPLGASFLGWNWSRARASDGALLTYDVVELDGSRRSIGAHVRPSGLARLPASTPFALPTTAWGLPRFVRGDEPHPARLVRTLEDGPFYARSLVRARLCGHDVLAMHESLSVRRLQRRWVRFLARFRMGMAKS